MHVRPPGGRKTPKSKVLEKGADPFHPQCGSDALKDAFPGAAEPPLDVSEAGR